MSTATPSFSAGMLLGLRVRLHGIRLGRPVDLLVDPDGWRALGFVVGSADGTTRFLPYAAAQPSNEEIAVGSALMLLDDTGFYRKRGMSFRALLGVEIERDGSVAGRLVDLVVHGGGEIGELELDWNGVAVRVPAAGSSTASSKATAA
jgi:hypothetical protein